MVATMKPDPNTGVRITIKSVANNASITETVYETDALTVLRLIGRAVGIDTWKNLKNDPTLKTESVSST